ncbi:MAG: 4-hydroxy-3-methylbut-2-enyl diphosphate reductase [Tidjanibacter sp.]|nr:4-hydroxy-3-methylbut-2-enyl diphosphate reductase [Tidjanibacter sp.]
MRVEVDDKSGFCFGVVGAIEAAERLVKEGRGVCSLGDLVHNDQEIARLKALGVETIGLEELHTLSPADGRTVLIRAHGEPKSTYRLLRERGLNYVDATCPVVSRLQKLVEQAYSQMQNVGGQLLILGKRGHAEVVGLNGQIGDGALVIESEADLEAVDFSRPIYLISQTTQSVALFNRVSDIILNRAKDPSRVTVHNTVCRQVAGREEHLAQFAARFDAVVFVCGSKSSNGQVLFEVCARTNRNSHKIASAAELRREWFAEAESVGVCGATSTPHNLMKEVADKILEIK